MCTAAPILSEVVRKCPLCQQSDLVVKRKRDGGYEHYSVDPRTMFEHTMIKKQKTKLLF